MSSIKRPELKIRRNICENFKNFELRFNDYCIQSTQSGDKDLSKDENMEEHYNKPLLEISDQLKLSPPPPPMHRVAYIQITKFRV